MGSYRSEPIAIVGSACRFPGSANSPSKLWELLKSPRDILKDLPPERLNLGGFYHRNGEMHGRTHVKNCSYLLDEDVSVFDATFFRISPKEANGMDPQQRILLETVFEATEAAGWPLDVSAGSLTSVHVGSMTADYNEIQMRDPDSLPTYAATGLAKSILANRISYFFDFKGPSLVVDTACSSSLVAIYQAVQGLRNGEVDQAIVAGVNLILDPAMYLAESTLHMLSQDSRCRMWDQQASGYARGEGCGAVILKSLSRALADGDHVECLIRETAVNSDGRTNGITMPSAEAQTDLIRKTYERAGLDTVKDGCQYFECHGTGTQAGDPVEARAIADAFFPDGQSVKEIPLYCGSIKTVIGHLEGGAGLAGLLKASLAIQNKTIPPNLHFKSLSPAVEPYYGHLNVPQSAIPWPDTNGQPLRASVNSFGFGGTNAHVILESYQQIVKEEDLTVQQSDDKQASLPKLFVFSAKSRASLLSVLSSFVEHIQSNSSLDLNALSSVLCSRRSTFAFRMSIAASDRCDLLKQLQERIRTATASDSDPSVVRCPDSTQRVSPRILGVFTGQGAQWACMGHELMQHSIPFRRSLDRCEDALHSLHGKPSWSLLDEIAAESSLSRLSSSEISQPVCTAIQIALMDVLTTVGIRLDAVVGHSSGEIGAAYAAGLLNIKDAMGIAYYRGLAVASTQSGGSDSLSGGMMAVAMSFDDAACFCSQSKFSGRIAVAASNSSSSVTLSGDLDAIHEAKQLMDEQQTFARLLRVDTAYHSHHMLHCEKRYLAHLQQLDIQVQTPRSNCPTWFSSVYPEAAMSSSHSGQLDQLKGQYWVDNMTKTVLFSQATQRALDTAGPFALALEVGPHPALKGPVNQMRTNSAGAKTEGFDSGPLPYVGCLERGASDVSVMASALSQVWGHLGPSCVELSAWQRSLGKPDKTQATMLKDLPGYAWQHSQVYWHESRFSRNYRLGGHAPHELLGRVRDICPQEITWRNILRLEEIPWMRGHMFQGQVVFPGAGYVSMALQAAQLFVHARGDRAARLVEIRDTNIIKALVIEEDSSGIELLFTVKEQSLHDADASKDGAEIQAEFTAYACSDQRPMVKCSEGKILIHLTQDASLPASTPLLTSDHDLPSLDVARFMSAVNDLGIAYEGPFRGLQSIGRTYGHAKAVSSWRRGELGNEHVLHPAVLDVAFQVGFASFLSMAERSMGTTYLPAGVRSVTVDVAQLEAQKHREDANCSNDDMCIVSQLVGAGEGPVIEVDLDLGLVGEAVPSHCIQVEGLLFQAVGEPLASDDRLLFSKTTWGVDVAYGITAPAPRPIEKAEIDYIDAVERTALFFLRTLRESTAEEDIEGFNPQHQALFRAIDLFIAPVRERRHGVLKHEWLEDTRQVIDEFARRYQGSVDLALLTAVGENLPTAVRGQSQILEHMLKDNLLSRLYTEGRGFSICNEYIAMFMRQISYKYPRTRILEIGAGTGGTTSSVLRTIGDAYMSYTYTDISSGFFEKAADRFPCAADKMEFRTLNVEFSPVDQGFKEESYDIIIAANILHATRRLSDTMRNVRSLLRPGGYLLAVEVTGTMLREPGLMGGLEGWWLGEDDGRFPSPGISAQRWDKVLRETGFSGVDTIAYDMPDVSRHNCSSFVTQAMDDRLEFFRDPLGRLDLLPAVSGVDPLVLIVGGQTLSVSKCIQKATRMLQRWTNNIQVVSELDCLDPAKISNVGAHVLYLAELDDDSSLFSQKLTQNRLECLQELLASAQSVVWVTNGSRSENPLASMAIGIGRALAFELPHVKMQFVDFETGTPWNAEMMVQQLLRLALLPSSDQEDHSGPQTMWSHEREIVVAEETTLISRVMMDDEANERFNARRRRLERLVGPQEHLQIAHDGDRRPRLVLAATNDSRLSKTHEDVVVDVILSTPLFIEDSSSCFLAYGKCRDSKAPVIVFSESDESVAHVNRHKLLEVSNEVVMDAQKLYTIAAAVVGQYAVSRIPKHGTTVIFSPTEGVAAAIQKETTQLDRNIMFLSTGGGGRQLEERPERVVVHPFERERTIRGILPHDTALLLYFSESEKPPIRILKALPKPCAVQLVIPCAWNLTHTNLAAALAMAPSLSCPVANVIHLEQITQHYREQVRVSSTPRVVDWRKRSWLNATIPPLRIECFFAPDKTYLLVGMTGELGRSLCQFMIDCGARHIVLASRSPPRGREQWFRAIHGQTAELQVQMVQMDVTNREQVHSVIASIKKTMPEIMGVANAALVLQDALFVNTTVDAIRNQLGPKVDGTTYLEEEFATCDLDFFLCFSSLASVFGNAGQSIYHAANMFITSLVERRRRRGQAASVVHVGMVVDAGYVARSTRSGTNIEKHLRSQFYMPLAEKEFHYLILQAVRVGRPRSSDGPCSGGEVTMGIQQFVDDANSPAKPQWCQDPRLSHMILPKSSSSSAQQSGTSASRTKKELMSLLTASLSTVEATNIYEKLFCIKIESMMKIPAVSIDTAAPLANLGLDSLVAVEIRAWLQKDLQLDVPLLGILSQESVLSICVLAANQLVGNEQTISSTAADTSEDEDMIRQNDFSDEGTTDPSPSPTSSGSSLISSMGRNAGRNSLPSPLSMTPPQPDQDDKVGSNTCQAVSVTLGVPLSMSDQKDNGNDPDDEVERVENMSYSQASMLFLNEFLEDATTFNVVAQYQVKGVLNIPRFQRALEKVLARHDTYRTRFIADAGGLEPRMLVTAGTTSGISWKPFAQISVESASQIYSVFMELSQRKWQLARGEAFQCVLVETQEGDTSTLIFGCHHVIMDGMSWHIFLTDLDQAYRLMPLTPVPFAYADFSKQQTKDIQDGRMDESIDFWLRKLDPVPRVAPLLPLSHRRSRKMTRVYKNHTVQRELAYATKEQILKASKVYRTTPMQFYLAALQILLVRLVDSGDELCIGVTDAGRGTSGQFGQTIGHFSNLLPIKFPLKTNMTVAEVMSTTAQIVAEAYEHAQVPLDLLLERLQIQRSAAHPPLFQTAFNYRVGDLLKRALGPCQLNLVGYQDARTPYDITINVTQSSTGSQLVEVTSNAHLYTEGATQSVLDMYTDLLAALTSVDGTTRLDGLSLRLLPNTADAGVGQDVPGNLLGLSVQLPQWPRTVTERIQEVWDEYPDSASIQDGTGSLTYKDLRSRVHGIAAALLGQGIGQGMHVCVLCSPSIDSHVAMLAVLWVGAVYVPLDMTLPTQRLVAMMNACKPSLLVHHARTQATVNAFFSEASESTAACSKLDLTDLNHGANEIISHAVSSADNDQEYSFILFTSGSTGTPKGIKLSQAGVMNYAASKSALLGLAPGARVLQQSSPGFDMAIAQAFNAFANAGTLIVAPLEARGDPIMLAHLMVSQAVELTVATPTEYLMLAQYAPDLLLQATSWRHACSGGEKVTAGLIDALQRLELPKLRLTDCYGPTETSCAATLRSVKLDEGESSSVGYPVPNTRIYIVEFDDAGEPHWLSAGQPGEICIVGLGVARGYLDEALSPAKFIPNPFATRQDVEKGWTTLYKTGDRGCLLPDGSLNFLGRIDLGGELIKLRGLRIELEEISRAIMDVSHGVLTDAVVTTRGAPDQFLVAHVVFGPESEAGPSSPDCRDVLVARLAADLALRIPRYMIPSYIVPLDRLPVTANGKVDRAMISSLSLPEDMPTTKQDGGATAVSRPLTVAQGELRLLWREVLGDAAVIRADTDFFTAGGSSLLLVRLQSLLRERMGISVPLYELYEVSTLDRMAARASHERGQVIDEQGIDWERETAMPSELQHHLLGQKVPSPSPCSHASIGVHVLLTGASGFLGSEILRALIAEPEVVEIHCIAVPLDKQQSIMALSTSKVAIYTGSLLSPTLGLSTTEHQHLQANVDCIIHAGAQGHCLNNYRSVRQANYISTQFLVALALPKAIPFHFISSSRVILQQPGKSCICQGPSRSMAQFPPGVDGSQGFTASKWASERFLERVVEQHQNLPVVIHRTCSLIGDRAPHDDAMNSVLRYSILSGTVPHLPSAQGFFDFKDVVEVARDIVCASVASTSGGMMRNGGASGGVEFRHHSSNVRVPFSELGRRLEVMHGGSFVTVPMAEWLRKAAELGIEELIVSYLEANVAGGGTLLFPYLGQ